MRLLLFAQDPIARSWWFDVADAWGNTASVVGLVVSVAGLLFTLVAFPVTWRIQTRIRRAMAETLDRIASAVLSAALESLYRDLTTAREAGRLGLWLRAFDCCHRAKFEAIRLVGNPLLAQEETAALRAGADDLTQVIRYIEGNKLGKDPPTAFQPDKRDRIDRMITVLTNIQARLATRTWEI